MTSEEALYAYIVVKVSLTLRIRNTRSVIWAGLLLLHYLHFGVSVHREQTPAAQPGARLSPISRGIVCYVLYIEVLYYRGILYREVDYRIV